MENLVQISKKKEGYRKLIMLIGIPMTFLIYILFSEMIILMKLVIVSLSSIIFGVFWILFIPDIINEIQEE